jgi:hypothetical protein
MSPLPMGRRIPAARVIEFARCYKDGTDALNAKAIVARVKLNGFLGRGSGGRAGSARPSPVGKGSL